MRRERTMAAADFNLMTSRPVMFLVSLVTSITPVAAAQSLIATPYPSAVGGNAQVLDPAPQRLGGPQRLSRDPYPQILGENAQGNAPITRRHRHQHLVPSINQRKYRVDRY